MGSEAGRTLSIVGGVLLFVGLIYSLMFSPLVGAVGWLPVFLVLLIGVGVLLDFLCGSILLFTKNGTVMVVAGILGLVSSIFLIGGIIGAIGGILGIIGGALVSAKAPVSDTHAPSAFLKKCVNCGREIPIASEECPYCQSKQS